MNKIILVGNLTAAPEIRTTNGGKTVCEFTLAVNRFTGDKSADFVRCTAFDKQADVIEKYADKGDRIGITGALRVEKYKDRNGNDKYKTYALVSEVELLGNRQQPADQAAQPDDDFPF